MLSGLVPIAPKWSFFEPAVVEKQLADLDVINAAIVHYGWIYDPTIPALIQMEVTT